MGVALAVEWVLARAMALTGSAQMKHLILTRALQRRPRNLISSKFQHANSKEDYHKGGPSLRMQCGTSADFAPNSGLLLGNFRARQQLWGFGIAGNDQCRVGRC
ncbi:hypothetical protein C8R44DRAFT_764613 [Mycena epipterygia]|nr:hypothetical protein C8R44DRAFT_764613 [Mycena epipterygia]